MRASKSFLAAGVLALTLAGPAFAQVGGGNELPSSATRPQGTGGTASTPENNGAAAPTTGTAGSSSATGAAPAAGAGTGTR